MEKLKVGPSLFPIFATVNGKVTIVNWTKDVLVIPEIICTPQEKKSKALAVGQSFVPNNPAPYER